MKFISLLEEQIKLSNDKEGYIKASDIVSKEVKKAKISLFFNALEMGYEPDKIREESKGIIEDFEEIVKAVGKNMKDKSIAVDISNEGGGGGLFDNSLIPDSITIIRVAFIFVIIQSITGFFQEAGKDFYVWIKNKSKKVKYGKSRHVYFLIRSKKKEARFLFLESFNEKVFEKAWKEMLKIDIDKLAIKKNEERIYIFDTKENKWVIFN